MVVLVLVLAPVVVAVVADQKYISHVVESASKKI